MVCDIIPTVLRNLPRDENGVCPVKVGFLTYGHTISFFNLAHELTKPQMMVMIPKEGILFENLIQVVGDVEDIFVPLQTGFMVDPDQSKDNISTLLKQIPQV